MDLFVGWCLAIVGIVLFVPIGIGAYSTAQDFQKEGRGALRSYVTAYAAALMFLTMIPGLFVYTEVTGKQDPRYDRNFLFVVTLLIIVLVACATYLCVR